MTRDDPLWPWPLRSERDLDPDLVAGHRAEPGFFNNDVAGYAVQNARTLKRLLVE